MRVLNRRNEKLFEVVEDAVYVGRGGPFGNPFKVGVDGTRKEVIEKYRVWVNEPEQAALRGKIRTELRGKNLVCWCAPLACHADLLLEWANREVTQ